MPLTRVNPSEVMTSCLALRLAFDLILLIYFRQSDNDPSKNTFCALVPYTWQTSPKTLMSSIILPFPFLNPSETISKECNLEANRYDLKDRQAHKLRQSTFDKVTAIALCRSFPSKDL